MVAAFWLGGVVCYIGFVLTDRDGNALDIGDIIGAFLWPITLALTIILPG